MVPGVCGLLRLLLPRAMNGGLWPAKNLNSAALILQHKDQIRHREKKS